MAGVGRRAGRAKTRIARDCLDPVRLLAWRGLGAEVQVDRAVGAGCSFPGVAGHRGVDGGGNLDQGAGLGVVDVDRPEVLRWRVRVDVQAVGRAADIRRWEVPSHGPVPDGFDAGRLGSCSPIGGSADGCRSASWPDNSLGRWGVDFEQAGRADGAPDELAAAVRADPVQDVLRAVAAPGALVRADKHVRGCRVEVPVAAFAIRPQLQHITIIDRQPRLEQHASVPVSTDVATSQPGERWWLPRSLMSATVRELCEQALSLRAQSSQAVAATRAACDPKSPVAESGLISLPATVRPTVHILPCAP